MKGCFISFEGVEGCGKTTQIERLQSALLERGHDVLLTREPGGTPVAEAIRALLLDPENKAISNTAELLLYAAARAQHVDELLRPALAAGKVVLCDRFFDSTTVYQGDGRELNPALIAQLNTIATQGLRPDRTYLLDLSVEAGLERARGRGRMDRLEQAPLAFHERVRAGYLRLAASEADRVLLVDGLADIESIAAIIQRDATQLLQERMTA